MESPARKSSIIPCPDFDLKVCAPVSAVDECYGVTQKESIENYALNGLSPDLSLSMLGRNISLVPAADPGERKLHKRYSGYGW